MASPAIFSGIFAKFLKSNLNLFDAAYILTGEDDPTSVAKNAPKGSLYLRQDPLGVGGLYLKSDDGLSTNWVDIGSNTGAGMPPVGSVVAYNPGYFADSSNTTFTLVGPATNDAAGINAYLSDNWRACDGAELNDAASPIFNDVGRFLPNLTDSRFTIGSAAAGTIGGAGSVTLTTTQLPSHTHTINHDHASANTSVNSADHTHSITHNHAAFTSGNSTHAYTPESNGGSGAGSTDYLATNPSTRAPFSFRTHSHSIDTPSFSGSSAANSVDHTHPLDLPSFSGSSGSAGSGSAFSILPTYLTTMYIMRVK